MEKNPVAFPGLEECCSYFLVPEIPRPLQSQPRPQWPWGQDQSLLGCPPLCTEATLHVPSTCRSISTLCTWEPGGGKRMQNAWRGQSNEMYWSVAAKVMLYEQAGVWAQLSHKSQKQVKPGFLGKARAGRRAPPCLRDCPPLCSSSQKGSGTLPQALSISSPGVWECQGTQS